MEPRQISFRVLAWMACLVLVTLFYRLSLETNGPDVGILQSWAISGWLATGHTLFLLAAYYWVTRVVYPSILYQRWIMAFWQISGLYLLIGLGTYGLYMGVGKAFLHTHPYLDTYYTRFKQAGTIASAMGHHIFLPNWWLYSLLVTATSLKIIRDVYRTKTQALQLELNLLRAQINPHFLFNTLNNIYSLVEAKDAYAAELLLKFGDIMRYTLYENNSNFIPLQQEITMLREYIDLEQIRHATAATATIDFQEEGHYDGVVIAPLLLITLVENAFKHGTQATIGSSRVDINLHIVNHQLHFQVSNSKPPMAPVRSGNYRINVHRIGLDNIRRRLQLLYPNGHSLTITDLGNSFTVQLTLPKHGPPAILPSH